MKLIKDLIKRWNSYKYRFLPWIAIKMGDQSIAIEHQVILKHEEVEKQLLHLLNSLNVCNNFCRKKATRELTQAIGFTLDTRKSRFSGAGRGVFVASGKVLPGQIVAFYPGTVYFPEDPKLFQSVCNPFMFRCKDYLHIDGKNWGVSKSIYKSCYHRDRVGVFECCDPTWISYNNDTISFNIGQLVNNSTFNVPANVHYQEFDLLHSSIPFSLRKHIPNINYNSLDKNFTRTVVLVATKEINSDEELLSSYFTLSY